MVGSVLLRAPTDPNQKALATAAEHLGELLEQAANAHELEDPPRRDVWRQLEEAAVQVATYAALLAGEEEDPTPPV